ncbi:MAG: hypothetical protein HOO93_12225 [Methyloglobulus sp.]|nr:hypothetical protein [Methyloglobulus sp.]
MKQIAIRKHYSYFMTNTSEIEECVFDEKMEKLDVEVAELLSKYDLKLISQATRFIQLEKMSVSLCEKCENLMINRDKNPAGFSSGDAINFYADLDFVIFDGGTHEGKNLCMECLPISHRWGYFS